VKQKLNRKENDDGIGIGGAQVLRSMDRGTGMHGAYQESRIDGLIEARDQAAQSIQGRAALVLARLDQMYFEGSINSSEASKREYLYNTLNTDSPLENIIKEILDTETIQGVLAMKGDAEAPWQGRAKRLTVLRSPESTSADPYLKTYGGDGWESFEEALNSIGDDEGALHSLSMSQQWKNRRATYRKWLARNDRNLPQYFKGEINVSLKLTPFEDSDCLVVKDLVTGAINGSCDRCC